MPGPTDPTQIPSASAIHVAYGPEHTPSENRSERETPVGSHLRESRLRSRTTAYVSRKGSQRAISGAHAAALDVCRGGIAFRATEVFPVIWTLPEKLPSRTEIHSADRLLQNKFWGHLRSALRKLRPLSTTSFMSVPRYPFMPVYSSFLSLRQAHIKTPSPVNSIFITSAGLAWTLGPTAAAEQPKECQCTVLLCAIGDE